MIFSKGTEVEVVQGLWGSEQWKDYVFTVDSYYKDDDTYAVLTPAGIKKLFKASKLQRVQSETPRYEIGDVLRDRTTGVEFEVTTIYSFGTGHFYLGRKPGMWQEDTVTKTAWSTDHPLRVGDFARISRGSRKGEFAEVVQDASAFSRMYEVRFLKYNSRAVFGRSMLEKLSTDVAVGDRVVIVKPGGGLGTVGTVTSETRDDVQVSHAAGTALYFKRNVRRISRFDVGDKVELTRNSSDCFEWTVTGQHGPDHVTLKSSKGTATVPVKDLKKATVTITTGSMADFGPPVTITITDSMPKTTADSDTLKKIEEQLETANILKYIDILNGIDKVHPLSAHDKKMRHELAVKVETRLGFPQY